MMAALDTLRVGSSLFIRYAGAGALLVLAVVYVEPGALSHLPGRVFGSEVLTALALFLIGAPVYHVHRELAIRCHHTVLCLLFAFWENVPFRRVPARKSWNPVRLLQGWFFGWRLDKAMRGYTAIRRSDFFEDREQLDVWHAANGIPVMLAEALLGAAIYTYWQQSPTDPPIHPWYTFLIASAGCLVISYFPAYSLHRREGARMKADGAKGRIETILTANGLLKKESWQTALDEFAKKVRETYDGRYGKVFLYGSRARGTADDGSDVDVLVVLNPLGDFWKESSNVQHLAGPICLKHDVVLSALPVDKNDFDEPKTPLLLNAKRDGFAWDER